MQTIEDALNIIEALVKEYGEAHVSVPSYQLFGNPNCIVGHAWSRSGVSGEQLRSLSYKPVQVLQQEGLLPFEMTLGAVAVYRAAQIGADTGTWGDALNLAITHANRFLSLIPERIIREAVALTHA